MTTHLNKIRWGTIFLYGVLSEVLILGLAGLVDQWPINDSRRLEFGRRLAESFARLSPLGQAAALELFTSVLERTPNLADNPELVAVAAEILAKAAASKGEVHCLALGLVERIIGQSAPSPDLASSASQVIRANLSDSQKTNRTRAVHLAMRPWFDLGSAVVILLDDSEPEVRRAAMLAVGTSEAAISTDELLHWLHDSDREVRQLCEKALKSRGLQDGHLRLGRVISDARPAARLEVFELLKGTEDLDPGVWLRRLSHDPSPALRAAAIRAAAEQRVSSLADRLQQMAQNDPSPTIRQLAQFYWTHDQ